VEDTLLITVLQIPFTVGEAILTLRSPVVSTRGTTRTLEWIKTVVPPVEEVIAVVLRVFVRRELLVLVTQWIGIVVMVEVLALELLLGTCAFVGRVLIGFTGIVE